MNAQRIANRALSAYREAIKLILKDFESLNLYRTEVNLIRLYTDNEGNVSQKLPMKMSRRNFDL